MVIVTEMTPQEFKAKVCVNCHVQLCETCKHLEGFLKGELA